QRVPQEVRLRRWGGEECPSPTRGCRMSPRVLVLFTAVLMVAAGRPPADDEKKELEKLQGEWKMVSLEKKGMKSPDDVGKGYTLTVKGDQWTVSIKGKSFGPTTIKLDPSKDPKTIDITWKVGDKETVSRGIYKLEDDTLTICRGKIDGERPKEFKSDDGGLI